MIRQFQSVFHLCATVALFCCGCVVIPPDNIVTAKATVFGLDVSNDPVTGTPHLRLGLVRYLYQRVPTSTNAVHAAPFSSAVDATTGIASQHATEKFSTTQK